MDAFLAQSLNLSNSHAADASPRLSFIDKANRESLLHQRQNSILLSRRNIMIRFTRSVVALVFATVTLFLNLTEVCGQTSLRPTTLRDESQNTTSIANRSSERSQVESVVEQSVEESSQETSDSMAGPLDAPIGKPRERRETSGGAMFALPNDVGRNTFLALGTVVVLFLGVAWLMRKAQPRAFSALPKEAVEVLGRVPIDTRQHLQLIRLGRKLVLFGVGPQGVMPLSEVDDPQEVESLLTACKARQAGSASESFRQILAAAEREPARGFLPTERKGNSNETHYQEPAAGAPRRRRTWLEA